MIEYLVRVGLFGQVGRFSSAGPRRFAAHRDVICRTDRGLEVGTVLAPLENRSSHPCDGNILRPLTRNDELIVERLGRHRDRAFTACQAKLAERGIDAVLVDVEHLFDGQSLFFYFLGPTTPELDELTRELAETYEQKVRFKRFAETLATGCGPDCGTGGGCSENGCSNCPIGGSCATS